ncbi:MAG: hypothetical protein MRY32_08120, partial [Rickettsiales bacterium]|nr:hypothetical protein [Rickettsiales bacterium]
MTVSPEIDEERAKELFEQALTSATRVLSDRDEISLAFGNRPLTDVLEERQTIVVSRPSKELDSSSKRFLRGQCDLSALVMRHHDGALHRALKPKEKKAAAVFDALEQMRVEAIGAQTMLGVQRNLELRMDAYCDQQNLGADYQNE